MSVADYAHIFTHRGHSYHLAMQRWPDARCQELMAVLAPLLSEEQVLIKRVDTNTEKNWGKGDRVGTGGRLWHGTAWSDCPESLGQKVAWACQCLLDRACMAIWLDEESWEWFRQAATDLAIQ